MARLALAATATCIVLAMSIGGRAAELAPIKHEHCKLKLNGPIEEGDQLKVDTAAKAAGLYEQNTSEGEPGFRLCLDSDGGSFLAGLEIAKLLREKGLGTFVDRGARCLSACAIAFLGGTVKGDEGYGANRQLHIQGRLGFHAPYLAVPKGNYDEQTVEAAYSVALRSLGALSTFGAERSPFSRQPFVQSSLVIELLSKGAREMRMIDTIDDAGRWQIGLLGLPALPQPSTSDLAHLCYNSMAWERGESSKGHGHKVESLHEIVKARGTSTSPEGVHQRVRMLFGGYVDTHCEVQIPPSDKAYLLLSLEDGLSNMTLHPECLKAPMAPQSETCGTFAFRWEALPPTTRLEQLSSLPRQQHKR